MASIWGNNVKISIYGESHGVSVGVVITGLPPGEKIDLNAIDLQMGRRIPGFNKDSSTLSEFDTAHIQSGVFEDKTTGAPLCAIIPNSEADGKSYEALRRAPRPSHADYTGNTRFDGYNDFRGGGHFSGRLTAALVFAGAVCRQILSRRGIVIGSHASEIASIKDTPFDPVLVSRDMLQRLSEQFFPVISPDAFKAMRVAIDNARNESDSVGGIVECAMTGLPAGIGSPIFDGVENCIASIVFGIPGVRGIEFGTGFDAARMKGSGHNDMYYYDGQRILTRTNHHGGAIGGITSGMPLIFKTAFKPTPSIGLPQESIDLDTNEEIMLSIQGRHDPCIVPRAIPAVEAAAAIALLDMFFSV